MEGPGVADRREHHREPGDPALLVPTAAAEQAGRQRASRTAPPASPQRGPNREELALKAVRQDLRAFLELIQRVKVLEFERLELEHFWEINRRQLVKRDDERPGCRALEAS